MIIVTVYLPIYIYIYIYYNLYIYKQNAKYYYYFHLSIKNIQARPPARLADPEIVITTTIHAAARRWIDKFAPVHHSSRARSYTRKTDVTKNNY